MEANEVARLDAIQRDTDNTPHFTTVFEKRKLPEPHTNEIPHIASSAISPELFKTAAETHHVHTPN